jgi:hypothetical protein
VNGYGEVWQLSNFANTRYKKDAKTLLGNECTCGAETIWDCSFWPRVNAEVMRKSGLSLRDLDLNTDNREIFRHHNKLVFDAVAEITGAHIIVDSSKLQDRLAKLIAADFTSILPLHLMRHPCGQICSVLRRAKRPVLRPSLRYCRETLITMLFLRGKPYLSVQYENLTRDPANAMHRIMEWVGLVYEPSQLAWSEQVSHNIDGNVIRQSKSSEIKSDEKWRSQLTFGQKFVICTLTLPAIVIARLWRSDKDLESTPMGSVRSRARS